MTGKKKSLSGAVQNTTRAFMHPQKKLPISSIRIDGGTQIRVAMNEDVIAEYAELMQNGTKFPPIVVFFDKKDYWLADGFHRLHAAISIGLKEIEVQIEEGTRRNAIIYSVGANKAHGLRRTNADKRNAVLTLINDEEWQNFSSRKIATLAGVGNNMVSNIKRELGLEEGEIIGADGKKYNMSSPVRKAHVNKERTKYYRFKMDVEYKNKMAALIQTSKLKEAALLKEAFEYLDKKYNSESGVRKAHVNKNKQ
jgi:hypothetical protein